MSKKSKSYEGYILLESIIALGVLIVLVSLLLPLLSTNKQVENYQNEQLRACRFLYEVSEESRLKQQPVGKYYLGNEYYVYVNEKRAYVKKQGQVIVDVKENSK